MTICRYTKGTVLKQGAVPLVVSDVISVAGRKKGGKPAPKKQRATRIVPMTFRLKRQSRPNRCFCCWNFRVHRPSNGVPAAGR
jgi:hypothetical protein